MMPLKICPYLPKSLDRLDVCFVLLHLLPESNGLLRLCWVDVFGPATLAMVHTSILCFITHCVHLVCMHIHMVEVEKSYSVTYMATRATLSTTLRCTQYLEEGVTLIYCSLVSRSRPAFRRFPYCKRRKAGQGLGMRLNLLTSCSDICGAYWIAMSTGFFSIKSSCRESSGGMSMFS